MMAGNTSAAVRQQRHEAPDSLDDFPTPPWATRALCEKLVGHGEPLHLQHVWEPACNRGYMARPLGEFFDHVYATDVRDYGYPAADGVADFLVDWGQDVPDVDWVITNPPFRLAADFIRQGLRIARRGVAVFVRMSFVEGQDRYETLFRGAPERFVMPFVERVALWKGVLLDPDVPVYTWNDRTQQPVVRKPTSATSYAWLVWVQGHNGLPVLDRVAPCRKRLTRPGDYPELPPEMRVPDGGAPLFDAEPGEIDF